MKKNIKIIFSKFVAEMWILKEWILSVQPKCYYGSVMKNKFSFSFLLQIDKKINVREDPARKTDSNFNFSQAT